jgi:hypothetical protein
MVRIAEVNHESGVITTEMLETATARRAKRPLPTLADLPLVILSPIDLSDPRVSERYRAWRDAFLSATEDEDVAR